MLTSLYAEVTKFYSFVVGRMFAHEREWVNASKNESNNNERMKWEMNM